LLDEELTYLSLCYNDDYDLNMLQGFADNFKNEFRNKFDKELEIKVSEEDED